MASAQVLGRRRDLLSRRAFGSIRGVSGAVPRAAGAVYAPARRTAAPRRGLADAVGRDHDHLDVLVSNAGIGSDVPGGGARQESADGIELRFAVNYLAGFALTHLLWPQLATALSARVVSVSSAGQAPIDFDDVMLERSYSGIQAYCQSKLAQIMMTFDLTGGGNGDPSVVATALHPSTYMPTKIVHSPVSTVADGVRATSRLVWQLPPDRVDDGAVVTDAGRLVPSVDLKLAV